MSSSQKRKRGLTRNITLLALRPRKRVKVTFNEYNQLVKQKKKENIYKATLGHL